MTKLRADAFPVRPPSAAHEPGGDVGRIIPYLAGVTGLIALAGALAVRLLAHDEFDSFGESVWWSAQTGQSATATSSRTRLAGSSLCS